MTKKLYLPLLMACVVALTSCSKKMGELSSDYFTVTPQVLEAINGEVPATINGKFPEKYFNKKAVVEVTPVLKWDGGEAKGQSATFQGEKVEGNDQTISYKMGGSYTMKTSFDYVPEMAKSELYLEFTATIGKKTVEIPEGVKTVLIFADKDKSDVGSLAAEALRKRLADEGRFAVIVNIPDAIPSGAKGIDWNDVLRMKGPEAFPVRAK